MNNPSNMSRGVLDALLGALLLKEDDIGVDDSVRFYANGAAELEQNGRSMRFGFHEDIKEEMQGLGLLSILIKRRGRSFVAYTGGRPFWNS